MGVSRQHGTINVCGDFAGARVVGGHGRSQEYRVSWITTWLFFVKYSVGVVSGGDLIPQEVALNIPCSSGNQVPTIDMCYKA